MILLIMDYVKVQNDDWLEADYCSLSKLSGEHIHIPGVKKTVTSSFGAKCYMYTPSCAT
jgi:hypothetical protein